MSLQAMFGLTVKYCKDGTFKFDLDKAPDLSPTVKELAAKEAAKKVPTLAKDQRLVFAYLSFVVEGKTGPTVGGPGPDPMARLLPLGFEVGLLKEYLDKKAMYQQGLYTDALKD